MADTGTEGPALDILARIDAGHAAGEAPLTLAVDVTHEATAWQLRALSTGLVPRPAAAPSAGIAEAVAALATQAGGELPPDAATELAPLEALDAEVRVRFLALIDAFITFQAAASEAFTGVDPESAGPGPEMGAVLAARAGFLDAAVALADARPTATGSTSATVDMCPYLAVDLVGTDTTYTTGCILVVDAGGNDIYRNNAGGNLLSGCSWMTGNRAAAVVDLGGNDEYGNPSAPPSCGKVGGGYAGAGLILDAGGNDRYHGDSYGANGGGYLGAGLIVDVLGSDVYFAGRTAPSLHYGSAQASSAGSMGANGGGKNGGHGLLVDLDGDDTYRAGLDVGALSSVGGVYVGSMGSNGGAAANGAAVAAGGIVDGGGRDVYHAGLVADTYDGRGGVWAGSFGVNGGGVLGAGFIIDRDGDDRYLAGAELQEATTGIGAFGAAYQGVNGGAGLAGAGAIVDGGGDDLYHAFAKADSITAATWLWTTSDGVNGGTGYELLVPPVGLGGSTGRLVDLGGDDTYLVEHTVGTQSGSNLKTLTNGLNGGAVGTVPSAALLLDTGGTDRYDDGAVSCTDCSVVPKGTVGAQVDA